MNKGTWTETYLKGKLYTPGKFNAELMPVKQFLVKLINTKDKGLLHAFRHRKQGRELARDEPDYADRSQAAPQQDPELKKKMAWRENSASENTLPKIIIPSQAGFQESQSHVNLPKSRLFS